MKFIINGYDYKDENALERRKTAREAHMNGIKLMFNDKNIMFAAAMLNENEEMCGSVLIVEFENRKELDNYLEKESYVINEVWEKVEVIKCAVPEIFLR